MSRRINKDHVKLHLNRFVTEENADYGPFLKSVNGVAGDPAEYTYWKLIVKLQNGTEFTPDVGQYWFSIISFRSKSKLYVRYIFTQNFHSFRCWMLYTKPLRQSYTQIQQMVIWRSSNGAVIYAGAFGPVRQKVLVGNSLEMKSYFTSYQDADSSSSSFVKSLAICKPSNRSIFLSLLYYKVECLQSLHLYPASKNQEIFQKSSICYSICIVQLAHIASF